MQTCWARACQFRQGRAEGVKMPQRTWVWEAVVVCALCSQVLSILPDFKQHTVSEWDVVIFEVFK